MSIMISSFFINPIYVFSAQVKMKIKCVSYTKDENYAYKYAMLKNKKKFLLCKKKK
jgi:hypothetical protein